MREIPAEKITEVVLRLCIEANCSLPDDVQAHIAHCAQTEPWAPARDILGQIMQNYTIAQQQDRPICQDTGMA